MAVRHGIAGKLYYGAAGAPAAALVENVREVHYAIEVSMAKITTRKANGWNSYLPGLKDMKMDWDMMYDDSDAAFVAIRTACLNGTPIALKALDHATCSA